MRKSEGLLELELGRIEGVEEEQYLKVSIWNISCRTSEGVLRRDIINELQGQSDLLPVT